LYLECSNKYRFLTQLQHSKQYWILVIFVLILFNSFECFIIYANFCCFMCVLLSLLSVFSLLNYIEVLVKETVWFSVTVSSLQVISECFCWNQLITLLIAKALFSHIIEFLTVLDIVCRLWMLCRIYGSVNLLIFSSVFYFVVSVYCVVCFGYCTIFCH